LYLLLTTEFNNLERKTTNVKEKAYKGSSFSYP